MLIVKYFDTITEKYLGRYACRLILSQQIDTLVVFSNSFALIKILSELKFQIFMRIYLETVEEMFFERMVIFLAFIR